MTYLILLNLQYTQPIECCRWYNPYHYLFYLYLRLFGKLQWYILKIFQEKRCLQLVQFNKILSTWFFSDAFPAPSGKVVWGVWVISFFRGKPLFNSIRTRTVWVPLFCVGAYAITTSFGLSSLTIRNLSGSPTDRFNYFNKSFTFCWKIGRAHVWTPVT